MYSDILSHLAEDKLKLKTPEQIARAEVLLTAALDLLRKCNEGPYVVNALEATVFYDDAECDGYCLSSDIADLLDKHCME